MRSNVLVIPCYNEATRLAAEPWLEFVDDHDGFSVLFVDDGSSDDTGRVLEHLCEQRPERLRWKPLPRNRGKAEAVRAGVLDAFAGTPDAIGFWDADLSTPLTTAPDFLRILMDRPEVQIVTGARVQLLGRTVERSPLRHYAGRIFAALASMALRLRVYDTQCGAKLFRATPDMRAVFSDPFVSRWAFDVELLARLGARLGSMEAAAEAIYELPLHTWIHAPGSKVRPLDFPRSVLELVRISRRYVPR
jgi:glycosyltransferase involved in cell wall biosynthesis